MALSSNGGVGTRLEVNVPVSESVLHARARSASASSQVN
jgi:hypothetical protein